MWSRHSSVKRAAVGMRSDHARFAATPGRRAASRTRAAANSSDARQTYLRLSPELRAKVDGPHIPDEPPATNMVSPTTTVVASPRGCESFAVDQRPVTAS